MNLVRSLVWVVMLASLRVADGAAVTVRATGTVSTVNGDLAPLAAAIGYTPALGDSYFAEYDFSTSASDAEIDGSRGVYPIEAFRVNVGPAFLEFTTGSVLIVNDWLDGVSGNFIDLYNPRGSWYLDPCGCKAILTSVYMEWTGTIQGGPLTSDALPPMPPPPSDSTFANMKLFFVTDTSSVGIIADIDHIAVVPVPAVGWLIGPLIAGLAWRRASAAVRTTE